MDIKSEVKKMIGVAIADFQAGEQAVEKILANPAVAPFVPVGEQVMRQVLASYGVPVDLLEEAGAKILSVLNTTAAAAAAVSNATASTPATIPVSVVGQA